MDILLRYDVPNLGRAGQAVTVNEGYARNFLLPRGIAERATKDNLARIAAELKRRSLADAKAKEECERLKARLAEISITISRKAGDDDKLFGSVTNQDICRALEKETVTIDRRKISVEPPIKSLGIHTVEVSLHPEVTATLRVWVVRE